MQNGCVVIRRPVGGAALVVCTVGVVLNGSCAATGAPSVASPVAMGQEQEAPMPKKGKPYPVTHNKTRYTFAPVANKAEWLDRKAYVRQHILVSAGLWPMPPKCPLKPKRLDRKAFDGFVREKIYFQSYPGVLVTGALYTPAGAKGRLPAVLCPHGHWKHGRLEEPPQARCINFAKQGYVVLAIDMVGYNDNGPITHAFKGDELWGLSLGGLQLWNCIRSIDLLASLKAVDPERIGVTGASGGGTQTFMVSAVDERVKVAAPVCMISAHFQGGCLCENAPLMRVVMNNMEIGAAMAPRPLVLVSATGDWTKNNPKVEYPVIRWAYELMGAAGKVSEKQFNLGHNYDKPGREVVYAWFARWLKDEPAGTKVSELPYELDQDLRTFTKDRPRPDWVRSARQFVDDWRKMANKQLDELRPRDAAGLKRFREVIGTVLRHTLCVEPCTDGRLFVWTGKPKRHQGGDTTMRDVRLGLAGRGYWLTGKLWMPNSIADRTGAVLVVHPKGSAAIADSVIRALTAKGRIVLAIDCLEMDRRKPTKDAFYHVYNRSNLAARVQEIMMGLACLSEQWVVGQVDLVGLEGAGLWALFARAVADAPKLGATVVDVGQFDGSVAVNWRKNEMFNPGMMRVGGADAASGLIAPGRLVIHNTGGKFGTKTLEAGYRAAGGRKDLRIVREKMAEQAIVDLLVAN